MKRIMILMLMFVFVLGATAVTAMAVAPKGEEMVTTPGVFVGSEPVSPAPLTEKDIQKIATTAGRAAAQVSAWERKGLLEAADTKAAKKLEQFSISNDNLAKKVGEVNQGTRNDINRGFQNILIAMGVVGVLLVLLSMLLASAIGGNSRKLSKLNEKAEEIPERTAEKLGKPATAFITFNIKGRLIHRITHFVTRENGGYKSLFITEEGDRKVYGKPHEARDSDKTVMKEYLEEDLQKRTDPRSAAQVTLIKELELAGRKPAEELKSVKEWIVIRGLSC